MNLYLFPEAACHTNGYGIAVEAAYQNLHINDEDIVVWYTSIPIDKMLHVRVQDYIIKRPSFFSIRSVINTIHRTNRSEISINKLQFLKEKNINNIYCDDTCFYHAIRKLYPNKPISIRFHNSFARIHDRLLLLKDRKVDFLFKITLCNMYNLERDVMRDTNAYKIFISNEDRNYYTLHYGRFSDSEVFDFKIDLNKIKSKRYPQRVDNKLVWFGGIESHKKSSINWFVRDVFPKIKKEIPNIEFHLWGRNSELFNNQKESIYGHGFFKRCGFPSQCSLYINPDIIGGGIKIKLMSLIEAGIPIISTPFGFEGYRENIKDERFCLVSEENHWANDIISYLKKYGEL